MAESSFLGSPGVLTGNKDSGRKEDSSRCAAAVVATACMLKGVAQRKLQMPLYRPNAPVLSNLAKCGISDVSIGISIADNIEGVEGIETESDSLLLVGLKVLERGDIDI